MPNNASVWISLLFILTNFSFFSQIYQLASTLFFSFLQIRKDFHFENILTAYGLIYDLLVVAILRGCNQIAYWRNAWLQIPFLKIVWANTFIFLLCNMLQFVVFPCFFLSCDLSKSKNLILFCFVFFKVIKMYLKLK